MCSRNKQHRISLLDQVALHYEHQSLSSEANGLFGTTCACLVLMLPISLGTFCSTWTEVGVNKENFVKCRSLATVVLLSVCQRWSGRQV